jgi:hypothetical protein
MYTIEAIARQTNSSTRAGCEARSTAVADPTADEDLTMNPSCTAHQRMFRLWIATYDNWRPSRWNDAPPTAVALEPVEEALYSAAEAALFLEGFNSSMLEYEKPIWAVAVPVTVRFEGDASCGSSVQGYAFTHEEIIAADPLAGQIGHVDSCGQ